MLRRSKYLLTVSLVSILFTAVLYGRAPALPFYSDDLPQIPWVERSTVLTFWTTLSPYEDYRPVHFTIWKLCQLLTGGLSPALLHVLNLAAHCLAGVLVGMLAARWGRRPLLSATPAVVLFVVFPFAYDAVPWVAAFSYPLATGAAVGALLLYLHAREDGSLPAHLLAVALTATAGLSHEEGVVAGPLILLAEVLIGEEQRHRLSRWSLLHPAASAAVLLVSFPLNPRRVALHGLIWPDLGHNVVYALQTLAYPIAPAANFPVAVGLSPDVAMGVVGLTALVALPALARRSVGLGPVGFALGWWGLWSLPPVLTLRSAWLWDDPRTLYPAAVGSALLWAWSCGNGRERLMGTVFAGGSVMVGVTLAVGFVSARMDLQQRLGNLLWEVVAVADSGEGPFLIVNLPGRVTFPDRLFPLGREGLVLLPPRVSADDLVFAHTGRSGVMFSRAQGTVLPHLPYAVQLLGETLTPADLRSATRVFLVVYRPDGMEMGLEEAGAVLPHQAGGTHLAVFGGQVALQSISCRRRGPHQVVVVAHWAALSPPEGFPTVFAHLVGDGVFLQADGDPLRGLYPFPAWRPGEDVLDVRTFEDVPAGAEVVAVGIWEPPTGMRWDAVGGDGEPLPEDVFRCRVR